MLREKLHRAGVIYCKPPIICFPVNRKWPFNILACGKSYIKFFIVCYLINPSQTQEAKRLLRSYLVHQKPIWEVATHGWLLEFWDQLLLFLVSQLLLTWRNKNIRRKNEHELLREAIKKNKLHILRHRSKRWVGTCFKT